MVTSIYQSENIDIIIDMAKILVIDDDINTTWLIDNVFSKEGYEIHTVNTSVTALSEALIIQPDLILLDLMMPEIDGLATIRELNKLLPEIKIIITSGLANEESIRQAFAIGASAFLPKPSLPVEILRIVNSLIGKS